MKANGSVDSNTYLTSASLPTVDQTIIDGSTNAVSGNAVFDGLATKFPTPTGLTTNYLPKWNGSSFGNSVASDNGTNFQIGSTSFYFNKFGVTYSSADVGNSSADGVVFQTGDSNDYIQFLTKDGQYSAIQAGLRASSSRRAIAINPLGGNTLFGKTDDNGVDAVQVSGTISASPATLPNQVVVKSQLDAAAARPYKVYTAVLTQQNTNAPNAVVLENTLGGTVVWTRNSSGNYYGTLNGAFTIHDKIALFQGGDMWGALPLKIIRVQRLNSNTIQIFTQQATDGALVDNSLNSTSIEIRVYN